MRRRIAYLLWLAAAAAPATVGEARAPGDSGVRSGGAVPRSGSGGRLTAPPTYPGLAALRRQAARYRKEFDDLFGDRITGGNDKANPLFALHDRWDVQIAGCGDDACRYRALRDQIALMQFVIGDRPLVPIRDIGWSGGTFDLNTNDASGSLSIAPVDLGVILVRIDTLAKPDGRWMCDLIAYGTMASDGSVLMHMLGSDVDPSQATFRMKRMAPNRFRVIPPQEDMPPLPDACGVGGDYSGDYYARRRRPCR
jgi:hypothetical protein